MHTYSNKSNAVRGFKMTFPTLAAGMSNAAIRMDFLDHVSGKAYQFNVEAIADAQQAALGVVNTSTMLGVPVLRRSAVVGAVGAAHQLYATLPAGTTRRDAVAFAVSHGIAFYTARTQYQRWSKAA